MLQDLKRSLISSKAIQLLWTTAKFSSDYEVVKWGIALGSLGENDEVKVRDLVMFARHPEFTIYSGYAIRRMAAAKPELRRYLVELLPFSHQWGAINLIQQIVGESDLIREHEVQRKVLIYGMANNGGIPMEVAFTIASGRYPKHCQSSGLWSGTFSRMARAEKNCGLGWDKRIYGTCKQLGREAGTQTRRLRRGGGLVAGRESST